MRYECSRFATLFGPMPRHGDSKFSDDSADFLRFAKHLVQRLVIDVLQPARKIKLGAHFRT